MGVCQVSLECLLAPIKIVRVVGLGNTSSLLVGLGCQSRSIPKHLMIGIEGGLGLGISKIPNTGAVMVYNTK